MKKRNWLPGFLALLCLLISSSLSAQVQLSGAQYWFDDNTAGAAVLPVQAAAQISQVSPIPAAGLSTGVHMLHVRFLQSNGKYSSTYSQLFIKTPVGGPAAPAITTCQYWVDNDYGNAVSLPVGPGTNLQGAITAVLGRVSGGAHLINVRFRDTRGQWTVTMSSLFFQRGLSGGAGPDNRMVAYRYWIDTMISKQVEVVVSAPARQAYSFRRLNFGNEETGTHFVHYQFKDSAQKWSAVVTDTFYNYGRPKLRRLWPDHGGNGGEVTVSIFGEGFMRNAKVRLSRAGAQTLMVPDSLIKYYSPQRLEARLDLWNKAVGAWDFTVENPGDTTMTLVNGFHIDSARSPEVVVTLVGPATIRRNVLQDYKVVIENTGNNDVREPIVWIYTPPPGKADFIVKDTLAGLPSTPPGTPITVPTEDEAEQATAIVTPSTPPEGTTEVDIALKSDQLSPITIATSATKPIHVFGLENKDFPLGCMMDGFKIIFKLLGATVTADALGCIQSSFEVFSTPFRLDDKDPPKVHSFLKSLAGMFIDCGSLANPELMAVKVVRRLSQFDNVLNAERMLEISQYQKECDPWAAPPRTEYPIQPLQSRDPNAKYGPLGFGPSHYIRPVASVPYIITFENEASATAAAQYVLVTDSLDLGVYDLATFRLGPITIGNRKISVPPGSREFLEYIDYRPDGQDLVLKVEAGIDETNGVVTWRFSSLNPETELPVTNPVLGFLPPNISAPEGEGKVSFDIKLKSGLPTNAAFHNDAAIYFDSNAPIVTAPWSNVVDRDIPESHVDALPDITRDSIVKVFWSGRDAGAGIRYYSIFISTNGGPYKSWKLYTRDTSATFIGNFDSTYSFYSVATDQVGNVEPAPATYDAKTTLARKEKDLESNLSVYPNPTDGIVNIAGINDSGEDIEIFVINIAGQTVYKDAVVSNGNKMFRKALDITSLARGYYSVLLKSSWDKKVFRVIKL